MFVDFARLPVLPQQSTQHSLSPHPLNLRGHTRLRGTFSLTGTSVTPLSLCGKEVAGACARVHSSGLDDDAAILDKLLYVCAGVGVANLRLLAGVEPNFALTDAGDGRREAFLRPKVDHGVLHKNINQRSQDDKRIQNMGMTYLEILRKETMWSRTGLATVSCIRTAPAYVISATADFTETLNSKLYSFGPAMRGA